jgi:hypothetical protein
MAKIPTSITISVSQGMVIVPATVTITGVLTDNLGNRLAGKIINLYMNTTVINTTTTDANGSYTFSCTFTNAGMFTFRTEFPGDETYEGCTSNDVLVNARSIPIGPLGLWWFPILTRLAQILKLIRERM